MGNTQTMMASKILFQINNQRIGKLTLKHFRTKSFNEDVKTPTFPAFTKWKRGLVAFAATSSWLLYNTSISPINGRRKLDMFSPQLRESSSKILFSVLSFLMHGSQEVVDMDSISYKDKLTNLMMDTMLENREVSEESDKLFSRVANIADVLMLYNKQLILEPPKFHIMNGKSLTAFSLGNHVVLSKGTLEKWTDTQLAFIIAHEISHHLLDHHVENLSWLLVEFMVTLIVLFYIIRKRVIFLGLFWVLFRPFRLIVSYPVRRVGEFEADDLGVEMLSRACIDIREVIMFW